MLLRLRSSLVRLATVLHDEVSGHRQPTGWGANYVAEIAKTVVIGISRDGWITLHPVPGDQIGNTGRMDAQGQDHRRRLGAFIRYFVASPNLHGNVLYSATQTPSDIC